MLDILLLNATRHVVVHKKSDDELEVGLAEIHVVVGDSRDEVVLVKKIGKFLIPIMGRLP